MGHGTAYETLALRWAELCDDPVIRELPGKLELNAYGVIEMSPASNRHGIRQAAGGDRARLGRALAEWRRDGRMLHRHP